jgi:hypothetical protein
MRLLNLVQMNFMEQLMLSSEKDLTGSKINGENIFVPSLEQTQAGFSIGVLLLK